MTSQHRPDCRNDSLHQSWAVAVVAISLFASVISIATIGHRLEPSAASPLLVRQFDSHQDEINLRQDLRPLLKADISISDEELNAVLGITALSDVGWKNLQCGNEEWWRGNRATAIELWHRVMLDNSQDEVAIAAKSNIAKVRRFTIGSQAAIGEYRELVSMPIDARNYKHDACKELSDLYLQTGDLPASVHYAELARHQFPLQDFCGVWINAVNHTIDERIQLLNQAIHEGRRIRVQ